MKHVVVIALGTLGCAALFAACAPAASPSGSSSNSSRPLTKSVALSPQGTAPSGAASNARGQAFVTVDGARARITVTLSGLEPGSRHAGHLHVGSCSAVGPVAVALGTVSADASGNGTVSASVDAARLSGSVYVAYHQRGPEDTAGIGSVMACGDVR